MKGKVVIIGGGVAGLAAAQNLARTHMVRLLEVRSRFGGRILTVHGSDKASFELGAEFVHGKAPALCQILEEAQLRTREVTDRHWKFESGHLVEVPDFWEQLSSVTDAIAPQCPDTNFAHFLAHLRRNRETLKLAEGFVEGFHAAPINRASAQATRLTEESSEKMGGDIQLRIETGYDGLIQHLVGTCRSGGVNLRTDIRVGGIDWTGTKVLVRGEDEAIEADRVIVTLPIGVLKGGQFKMNPQPTAKIDAINALAMGAVTKVILHFRRRFWPKDLGFIHSDDPWFQTWWSNERENLLTAWSGGPKGENLSRYDEEFVIDRALEGAGQLFGENLPRLREHLLGSYHHNWQSDPFAKGAYSYIPVNGTDAAKELARPEQDRVFFAGEATDLDYQFGTVHGAIGSGLRAAEQVRVAS